MYESFYGLKASPFELALNPRQLLLTPQHEEALANLELGLRSPLGITVLTGEAGTGKTSLIRAAFARAEAQRPGATARWALLRNPTLSRVEFKEFLVNAFQLSIVGDLSKVRLLDALERQLLQGQRCVLIVDEAQSVPHELLEEVRLLANVESDSAKLLPVVLAGQPELAARLNEPSLRQLKQRVALRCSLGPLTMAQTGAYMVWRIQQAGGSPVNLFSRDAVVAIYERSGGIPRIINVICHNSLLTAFADGVRPVTRKIVDSVCRDFDLSPVGAAASQQPVEEVPFAQSNVTAFNRPSFLQTERRAADAGRWALWRRFQGRRRA
jgi:general secretion pathway protein A